VSDDDGAGKDERAERRDARRDAERDRMRKHGARTGAVYRDAILKRLRDNAGAGRRRGRKKR
jgi:hypothetical protein